MITAHKDKNGGSVDWWFVYKLPKSAGNISNSHPTADGFQYLYFDSEDEQLILSSLLLSSDDSAVQRTLAQIDNDNPADTVGWYLYNDEIPDEVIGDRHNDEHKGHTKGVVIFDTATDTALWLLHSTPRWSIPGSTAFPDDERIYGQTFLCISLKNIATAESIAAQMLQQQQPQIYSSRLPDSLQQESAIRTLVNTSEMPKNTQPSTIHFSSRAGQDFQCFAKNRAWGEDFWIDLVAHELKTTVDVESWRRGSIPATTDPDDDGHADDVQFVNLKKLGIDSEWKYTHDHSKWAIAESKPVVLVADINRQTSQEKRGGGAIGFTNEKLWAALKKIELFTHTTS
ncbi:deoxyribonuclease II family protein [Marinicella sp. W31]|uniref:deoxyribonuclease II family protein n=1 Tax=Marinicella sp. W31 TaxID=3023713 RepID=UPI003756A640